MWLCWILLAFCSGIIAYQDFKTRLISLWLVILFGALNVSQYIVQFTFYQFLENVIFSLCYFLFIYLVLHLFYFIKKKKFDSIINSELGLGDLLIFLSIGICIEPVHLIYFFTVAFIMSLLVHILFFKNKKSVPLAGFLVLFYLFFLVVTPFFIEC